MVIMGAIIWLRYFPLIKVLENGVRTLVCSVLVMVTTIIAEQCYYGAGRFTGKYVDVAMNPLIVGALKIGYIASFCYMLYAFWLLAPSRPKLMVPFALSFTIWAAITVALMF